MRESSIVGMNRPRPLQFSQLWTPCPEQSPHVKVSPAVVVRVPVPRHSAQVNPPVPMQ